MVGGVCKHREKGNYWNIKKYGVEIPFMKPKKLATDNIKEIDVVLYAIDWLKENDKRKQYDLIMLFQPT